MSQLVCGTRLEAAADDACARTVLLSDLHLVDPADPAFGWLAALLVRAERGTRVLVLGDLFDAYASPKQSRTGIAAAVAGLFCGAVRRGIPVTVLHGNRDFMLDGTFAAAAGCRVVAGGLVARLGDRRLLALHGDELCWHDRPYQRAKRWLRHPLTRFLLRTLPCGVVERLSGRARERSRSVIGMGDQERFHPVQRGLQQAFAAGAEVLVFGHIHRPARGFLAPGQEYCILPAFEAAGVHLVATPAGLGYVDAAGGPLPDFPPRTFPE